MQKNNIIDKPLGSGIFIIDNDKNNIFVIGDIHGDYQCLIHCLVDLCNVCSITKIYDDAEFKTPCREYIEWNKNNTSVIVLCGDLIDRKRFPTHVMDDESSDIYIIKTLLRLKKEAICNNGNVLLIAGNHEIMNISLQNNMYVSEKNIEFNSRYFNDVKFVNKYIENSYAWIKINDILITHGGLCSEYLTYLSKDILSGNIIEYINKKYKTFFTNFNKNSTNTESLEHR